jgi:hypothetical protein
MRQGSQEEIESGGTWMHSEEIKKVEGGNEAGKRVFGVVLKGYPDDFQMWLDSAKTYGLYVIFSKSSRTSKLVIKEESW